jgi:aldose 1-epimerase
MGESRDYQSRGRSKGWLLQISKTAMNDNVNIALVSGNLRAEFWPSAGMLGASLRYRGEELLRRIDDFKSAKRKGSTAGIPLLYPWANRLAALHYRAAGRDVVLDPSSPLLHFDNRGLPMHGVPWGQLAWEVLEAKQSSLLTRIDWNRPDLLTLFPFPHRVQIAASLTPDSLTLQTTVFANAESPVPISFGFHPYFGIPGLARPQWRLQLPAMRRLQLDPRGIPAGSQASYGPLDTLLGDANFDDGFALLDERSCFSLCGAGHNITVAFLEGFPYAQVFAPREKDFIALEPMTAPTSALTTGEGLRILEPNNQFQASFRITVHSSN